MKKYFVVNGADGGGEVDRDRLDNDLVGGAVADRAKAWRIGIGLPVFGFMLTRSNSITQNRKEIGDSEEEKVFILFWLALDVFIQLNLFKESFFHFFFFSQKVVKNCREKKFNASVSQSSSLIQTFAKKKFWVGSSQSLSLLLFLLLSKFKLHFNFYGKIWKYSKTCYNNEHSRSGPRILWPLFTSGRC